MCAMRISVMMTRTEESVKQEREICHNRNHGRSNVQVRFCPDCGRVVAEKVTMKPEKCPETVHAQKRRWGHNYCVDCGERLREKLN